MIAVAALPALRHALDARPVLESAPLRASFSRAKLSRVGDASWDFSPAIMRANVRRCHVTAHFAQLGDPRLMRTLKEFLYARFNFDLPGVRMRLPPASLRQCFNRARRFLEFVHGIVPGRIHERNGMAGRISGFAVLDSDRAGN